MNQVVSKSQTDDPVVQWVTFRLGDETYGIDVLQVKEVLRVSEIAPVPGAQPYVMGIINLRGNVITVIDTRLRFGLPNCNISDTSRIVIIESGNNVLGALVDSVAEVVELRRSQIDLSPNLGSEDNAKCIEGVTSFNNELLILVDINKLLNAGEMAGISEFG